MLRQYGRGSAGLRCISYCNVLRKNAAIIEQTPSEIVKYVYQKLNQGDLASIKTYKNKLIRLGNTKYAHFLGKLKVTKDTDMDTDLMTMIFYRYSGPKQYTAFVKRLISILAAETASDQKMSLLYKTIQLQHALYPTLSKLQGILVPEEIHKWFWENVPKNESFKHYYFLIQNNVLLSSPSCSLFQSRLLKGSEMDFELATFQIFLHDPKHQSIFYEKFVTLCNFSQINILANMLIQRDDYRHTKIYLTALLSRLEKHELLDVRLTQKQRNALFMKFTKTLLNFLKRNSDHEMFLDTLSTIMAFVRVQKLPTRLLHQPILLSIQYLRSVNQHTHVLQLISMIYTFDLSRSFKFEQSLLGELVSTLRSFNDPKVTLSYITTAFSNPSTVPLMNELGIWSFIHHNTVSTLSASQLQKDSTISESWNVQLPKRLKRTLLPNSVILTELYRVILHSSHNTLPDADFKQTIIDLYHKYKQTLINHRELLFHHDCGILNILLFNLRYKLKEDRLSYDLLQDFYRSDIQLSCNTPSPFGLVLYHNYMLTQTEVSSLLFLMDKNEVPLDFKVIISMVFRHLRWDQVEEARSWYEKLLHAGFLLKHRALLQCALAHNWVIPNGVDKSLLEEQDGASNENNYEGVQDLLGDETLEEEFEDRQAFADSVIEVLGSIRN